MGTDEDFYDYYNPLTLEFDVIDLTAVGMQIQFYDDTNLGVIRPNTHGIGNGSHVKIQYTGDKLLTTVDGISKPDINVTFNAPFRIGFRIGAATYITYKNFIVYSE